MATNSSNNNGSSNGKSNISIDNNSDDEKDSFDDGEKGTTYSNNSKVFVKSQYKSNASVQYGGNEVVLSACLVYIK